jgi:hypothetical protein
MDQTGEEQNHISTLVHDGAVAVRAAHLARKFVSNGFGARIVPFQVVVAVDKVDVCFVENGCPLEWCRCFVTTILVRNPSFSRGFNSGLGEDLTMLGLTGSTMAQFTIQRRIPAQLILHPLTMTVSRIHSLKIFALLMDAIWGLCLPFVHFATFRGRIFLVAACVWHCICC